MEDRKEAALLYPGGRRAMKPRSRLRGCHRFALISASDTAGLAFSCTCNEVGWDLCAASVPCSDAISLCCGRRPLRPGSGDQAMCTDVQLGKTLQHSTLSITEFPEHC